MTVSIAIDYKFSMDSTKEIEDSLGTKNIFSTVYYYCSYYKKVNYTIIFFKGGERVSSEYIQILSYRLKTKGIYCSLSDTEVEMQFFDQDSKIFKFNSSHPDEISLDGNFVVERSGEVNSLNIFKEDANIQNVEKIIHGDGQYFLFPATLGKNVLSCLGLESIRPMLFWDYDLLTSHEISDPEFKKLIQNNEFPNLHKLEVKPSY